MDIITPILILVLVFVLLSVCGCCCKRKREGTVYGLAGTNVTVSTQPISAMTGAGTGPPYPVEAQHPIPQTGPTQTVFTHNPPYPRQNPHPIAISFYTPLPVGTTPYPPAATSYPPIANATLYPPTGPPIASSAPFPDYSGNPPSYSEAVGELPVHPPPLKEGYSKQSPYNPNY